MRQLYYEKNSRLDNLRQDNSRWVNSNETIFKEQFYTWQCEELKNNIRINGNYENIIFWQYQDRSGRNTGEGMNIYKQVKL